MEIDVYFFLISKCVMVFNNLLECRQGWRHVFGGEGGWAIKTDMDIGSINSG